MNPIHRIGIPSVIPFARRKSESTLTPQTKNRELLSPDLLSDRLNYLKTAFECFDGFESSKNVNALKEWVIQSSTTLKQMVDQAFLLKETMDSDAKEASNIFGKQLEKLKKQNQNLKKQLDTERKRDARINEQYEQQTGEAKGEQQISTLEQSVFKLKREAEELTLKNNGMAPNLIRKPFFKEFEFMHLECEGLNKQNDKLKENIKIRKEELKQLKLQGK